MNKKVLSAILFSALFAGTGTFTSCIDNDEPAGIEELRGAKAELIRAKVAVEQAEAAYKLAQAEHEKAEAAIDLAEAKIKEASAKLEEARAEAKEIENEEARAELDKQIAEWEMELEQATLEHELAMVEKQQALAEAKRSYEIALKQIAIAEALMSESQKVAVSTLKAQVNTLMGQIAMVEDAIEAKQEELYHASMYLGADTEYQIAYAEQMLAEKEAALEANADVIAKYKKYMEVDSTAAESDWRAEIAAIEAEVAEYDKQIAVLKLEATKKENSEEAKALAAAVEAAEVAKAAIKAPKVAEELTYAYMYFGGSQEVEGKIAEGEKMADAIEELTGEGNTIDQIETEKASYTEEKKAYLKKLAASETLEDADYYEKAYTTAKTKWAEALTAYNAAVASAKDVTYTTPIAAYNAYDKAITAVDAMPENTNEEKYKKYVAGINAKETFADALVAWYNTLPTDQVTFNSLTLSFEEDVKYQGEVVYTKTTYVTKTAKEWLSDEDNKAEYLTRLVEECFGANGFYAYWGEGASWKEKYTNDEGENAEYTTAKDAFGSVVTKADYLKSKKNTLVSTSNNAFGEASLYLPGAEYLTVEPSASDAKYVGYENAKAYGLYLGYKDEGETFVAKNLDAILADLDAAIEFWTAAAEEMTEAVEAYEAEKTAAKKVVKDAKKALEVYLAAVTAEYDKAEAALNAKVGSLKAVKSALINAVDVYLAENYSGEVNFMDWLAAQVKDCEAKVIDLEYAVAKAEADLKAAEEGHFLTADNVATVQKDLNNLEEKLAGLVADLEAAIAALATAEEIWAE